MNLGDLLVTTSFSLGTFSCLGGGGLLCSCQKSTMRSCVCGLCCKEKCNLPFSLQLQDILAQVLQILLKSKLLVCLCTFRVELDESLFLR